MYFTCLHYLGEVVMKSGWLVTVAKEIEGKEPSLAAYVIVEPDPVKAVTLLHLSVPQTVDQTLVGIIALRPSVLRSVGIPGDAVVSLLDGNIGNYSHSACIGPDAGHPACARAGKVRLSPRLGTDPHSATGGCGYIT